MCHQMIEVISLLNQAKVLANKQTDPHWLGEKEQTLLDRSLLTIDQTITMLQELGETLSKAPELDLKLGIPTASAYSKSKDTLG